MELLILIPLVAVGLLLRGTPPPEPHVIQIALDPPPPAANRGLALLLLLVAVLLLALLGGR